MACTQARPGDGTGSRMHTGHNDGLARRGWALCPAPCACLSHAGSVSRLKASTFDLDHPLRAYFQGPAGPTKNHASHGRIPLTSLCSQVPLWTPVIVSTLSRLRFYTLVTQLGQDITLVSCVRMAPHFSAATMSRRSAWTLAHSYAVHRAGVLGRFTC